VKLPIIIHPKNSGIIIINYPGFNGEINGYNNKYRTLAKLMQERIGAVIQSGNQYHEMLDYKESVKDDLRAVIEYSLENAENICQTKIPTIYLVGFSAGASAIAAVAHEYPAVSKILLISPSADAGFESLQKGLSEYTGEVYILSGSNDDVEQSNRLF
jgi:predicted esterase